MINNFLLITNVLVLGSALYYVRKLSKVSEDIERQKNDLLSERLNLNDSHLNSLERRTKNIETAVTQLDTALAIVIKRQQLYITEDEYH